MTQIANIYCDESRYSNNQDSYLVIGAVKCLREDKADIVSDIERLKARHGISGEIGWKTVSKSKADFYMEIVDWFANSNRIVFRCVMANKRNLWSRDDEDAFYVVYHQLLSHWMASDNIYHIYLDRKKNSRNGRIPTLKQKVMRDVPETATIACAEEVESRECVPVQIADLLIGAVGYAQNRHADPTKFPNASPFKSELCSHIAKLLGRSRINQPTVQCERKFNVFLFGE